jgi:spore coat protein B
MEDFNLNSFLESLRGYSVTIYRGGPESRTGKLLDVQSDYVTLHALDKKDSKKKSVVYYQLQHIKSVSEDSKVNSLQTVSGKDAEAIFSQGEDYMSLIGQFIDQVVKINQGGPESKKGTLLAVSDDHLVLFTKDDGIVYYNVQHVKSISLEEKNEGDKKEAEVSRFPFYINAENFHSLFRSFTNKWVAINRGGPEAMEGVLVENAGGHYTLVSNQEILRVHPYHIRSISVGPKGSLKQEKQSDGSSNSAENSSDESNNQESSSSTEGNKTEDNNTKDNKSKDDNSKDKNSKDDNSKDKDSKDKDSKDKDSKDNNSKDKKNKDNKKDKNEDKYDHVVKTVDYIWKRKKSSN